MRGGQPKWIFQNLGDLVQPLEFVQTSREQVVPTEWQVRSVLGDCISKAKSDFNSSATVSALISDFLDLSKVSIGEEAALATNWIKDRREGLKLQSPLLATITGPS